VDPNVWTVLTFDQMRERLAGHREVRVAAAQRFEPCR
jgi:hypothetical protein